MFSTLDSRSPAARRGLSDLSIRNLFIIPTIAFLIVFNIFPLIYSHGYSFTDFRASSNAPAAFVGLQNYRDLLNDDHVWNNFSVTARYVLLSVGGQVLLEGKDVLKMSAKEQRSLRGRRRSEERRVGKECRMPCRSRWSPYH